MKVMYHIFIQGIPKAQPRPRMAVNGHVYNPNSADIWKNQIKACFLRYRKPTITEPVELRVNFFLPCPKSMKEKKGLLLPHAKKPDTDNLLKAVMDSLTDIEIWKDDAQVFNIKAGKYYAQERETGALITISIEEGQL